LYNINYIIWDKLHCKIERKERRKEGRKEGRKEYEVRNQEI